MLAFVACAAPLFACGGASSSALPAGPARGVIGHVVIIVQENRSFDNLFEGAPGADTRSYGYGSHGNKITLKPVGLAAAWDLQHTFASFLLTCNGRGMYPGTDCRMNGFDRERVTCGGPGELPCPNPHPQYAYVPRDETKPYFEMAREYVLADRMFASNLDESSFVSHQYIIAGQASAALNFPLGGPW
ncbi:MAG: alkaline phosphatase family protein, partial [Candidatus Cybelea sp.]